MEEAPSKVPTLGALAFATIKKELKTPKMIEALNNATPSQQNVVAQTMSEGLVEYKDLTQESSCPNFCSLLAQQLLHKIVLPHCLQTPVCYEGKDMEKRFYSANFQFISPKAMDGERDNSHLCLLWNLPRQHRWSAAFFGEKSIVYSCSDLQKNNTTLYDNDLGYQVWNNDRPEFRFSVGPTYDSSLIVVNPKKTSKYYFVIEGCSGPHKTESKKYPYSRSLRKRRCNDHFCLDDTVRGDLSSIEGTILDAVCLPDDNIVLCVEKENPDPNSYYTRQVQIWLIQPSNWGGDNKPRKSFVINTSKEQDELKLWAVDGHTFAIASYVGSNSYKKLTFFNLQTSEHSEPINFSEFYALDSHCQSPNIALFSSNGRNGTVLSVFDKASKTTTPLLEIPENLGTLKLSPNGQFCVGFNRETVYLFDLFNKLILARFSNPCKLVYNQAARSMSENTPIAISDDSMNVVIGRYFWHIGAFHYLNNPSIGAVATTMDVIEYQKEIPHHLRGRRSSPQEILERHLDREYEYKAGK